MNNRDRMFLFVGVIAVAAIITSIVFFSVILRQKEEIELIKQSLISLTEGEKITYFDLIGTEQEEVTAAHLNQGSPALIFVLKQPCATCNHNLTLWRRMARILEGKVSIYGIWLGNPNEMFNFQETARLGFKL